MIIRLGRLRESRRKVLELRIDAESAESSQLYHCSEFVAEPKWYGQHSLDYSPTLKRSSGNHASSNRNLYPSISRFLGPASQRTRSSRRPAQHRRPSALRSESATGSDRPHEPRPSRAEECLPVQRLHGRRQPGRKRRPGISGAAGAGPATATTRDVLNLVNGILDAEPDQTLTIPPNVNNQATASTAPQGLWDNTPVNYYGNIRHARICESAGSANHSRRASAQRFQCERCGNCRRH